MLFQTRRTSGLGAALIAVLTASHGTAQVISFTRIASTTTAIPGGSGTFTDLREASISGGSVAFLGSGTGGQMGVYATTGPGGSLVTVANTSTAIPSGTGTFAPFFQSPVISGTGVAFRGTNGSTQDGLYTNATGPLTRVMDLTTPIPGGTGAFTSFSLPTISSGVVAFQGGSSTGTVQSGVYTGAGGTVTRIADRTTPFPGAGADPFGSFTPPSIAGGTVAFAGTSQSGVARGVFTAAGGALSAVATQATAVPSGVGTFSGFFPPSIDGSGAVAFEAGFGVAMSGIYTNAGGPLRRVVDVTMPIPGGTGTFLELGGVGTTTGIAASDGNVAFLGLNSSFHRGIYANVAGSLFEVIGPGDALDGRTVGLFGLDFHSSGMSGNQIAFSVTFTDLSRGIYVATLAPVPEPSGLLATVAIGVGAWRGVRRWRAKG